MSDSLAQSSYPGERLGLQESGPGSIARLGRRIAALAIDWASATVIAAAFFGYQAFGLPDEQGIEQFAPMMVFILIQAVFIPTIGGSPGHRIVGLRLVRIDGAWSGVWRPFVRTVLLALVIPAVIWDADHRGLHDKAAGTMLLRA